MSEAKLGKEVQLGAIESRLPYFDGNINSLHCIAAQLEAIIDRINGPEPCAKGSGEDTTLSEGILCRLDDLTGRATVATERIGRAVDKLCGLI